MDKAQSIIVALLIIAILFSVISVFAAFLVLIVYGAGMWSLERALLKKEYF